MNKKSNKNWISFDIKVDQVKNDLSVASDSLVKHFSVPVETKKSYNFFEKVVPLNESDLGVHPKKIKEVEEWLLQNIKVNGEKRTTSILLITGPTGSGKTATVNVVCKKLGIRISEWVNPVDQDYEVTRGPGQSTQFLDFLLQSKYSSLLEDSSCSKKITLVEDFPNSVIRKPDEFFTILEKAYYKARSAIVFICADEDISNNISHQLFPQNVRELYRIKKIAFNACSVSLMKSSLKRACGMLQERSDLFTYPSNDVLEAIVITSSGDIRSAMNQLYFASSKAAGKLEIIDKCTKSSNKRKRSAKPTAKLKNMCKDESLTLFHGVGRILNPKRIDNDNKDDGSWRLDVNMESLIGTFAPNPRKCILFLQENYLKYYGDIEDVSTAADILSFSQTFFDKWSEEYDKMRVYGLWIATLGLMVHNEHKVSKWNQITGPTKLEYNLQRKTDGDRVECLDKIYYNLISKTQQFSVLKRM